MSITADSPKTRGRVSTTPSPQSTTSVPSPIGLSIAQLRELETELRRELAALERRLASERQVEAAETHVVAAHEAEARRASDTSARRDVLAAALARLASGEYGAC